MLAHKLNYYKRNQIRQLYKMTEIGIDHYFDVISEQLSSLGKAFGYAVLAPLCTISSSLLDTALPEHK